jgi:hypothetical protein
MYRRFGAAVTVVEMGPRLVGRRPNTDDLGLDRAGVAIPATGGGEAIRGIRRCSAI